MPIFFQQDVDPNTRLAIWEIGENEQFFLDAVPLQREITHPHKRLQHLAGRYLLKQLFPSFPIELIRIADTRKPFLEDEAYHFSISHCGDFAGVIVSRDKRVGIDIELISEKIRRIRHKFISAGEEKIMHLHSQLYSSVYELQLLTALWSCKEAVFKWYGAGGVDFREHMQMKSLQPEQNNNYSAGFEFRKGEEISLMLHTAIFGELCMSYVVT